MPSSSLSHLALLLLLLTMVDSPSHVGDNLSLSLGLSPLMAPPRASSTAPPTRRPTTGVLAPKKKVVAKNLFSTPDTTGATSLSSPPTKNTVLKNPVGRGKVLRTPLTASEKAGGSSGSFPLKKRVRLRSTSGEKAPRAPTVKELALTVADIRAELSDAQNTIAELRLERDEARDKVEVLRKGLYSKLFRLYKLTGYEDEFLTK